MPNPGLGDSLFSELDWDRLAAGLHLSARDVDVLRLVIADRKEVAIARALGISSHTVHTHLGRIYRKLGANGRVAALVALFRTYLRSFETPVPRAADSSTGDSHPSERSAAMTANSGGPPMSVNGARRRAGRKSPGKRSSGSTTAEGGPASRPARKTADLRTGDITMPAADEAMNELQNKWYNAVTKALGLDAATFQFFQAQRPLGATSDELWTLFDSVPPLSLTQTQVISGHNSYFGNYESIVLTILPQGGRQFEEIMGDELAAWEEYRKSLKPGDLPKGGIVAAFKSWAELNLNPAKASKAYAAYKQLQNGIVSQAVDAVLDDDNLFEGGPTFKQTIDDLRGALDHGRDYTLHFDSSTESSDVKHTWAKGELGGAYEFFSGKAGASWDKLSEKASKAEVEIEATLRKVATMSINPGPWYMVAALNLAYKHSDNTVWPAGQSPTWDDLFSDQGSLQRLAVEIVAFDGIEISMTSSAAYDETEQEEIKASAEIGFWPFFSASGEGGSFSKTTFNDAGQMTVTSSVPRGNPAILGVNVLPIAQVIAAEERRLPLLGLGLAAFRARAARAARG